MGAELWKTVVGFSGYEVSNHGHVRSILMRQGCRAKIKQGILRGWTKFYHGKPVAVMIGLRKEGQTFEYRLHRLVLEAFIGPCPDGMEGCHGDGNPLNNHLDNLRWDTHIANVADCIRHGRKTKPPIRIGEKHHNTKLTAQDILFIRSVQMRRGSKAELARKFNVAQITITRILRRKVWVHL